MAFGTPGGFGSNPARGAPSTSRGGRTTAGSHRIQKGVGAVRGSGGYSHGNARPIEDFPKMFRHLRQASEELPRQLVVPLANAMRDQLLIEGSKYRIRGHQGKKFPLVANVQVPTNSRGASQISRFVVGTPPGFWRIVNDGSKKHLIAGRYRSGGGRQTAKGAFRRFVSNADEFGGSSPVNVLGHSKGSSEGWAQYVVHPGHGPLGHPWRTAMNRGETIMWRMQNEYATAQTRQAFFR